MCGSVVFGVFWVILGLIGGLGCVIEGIWGFGCLSWVIGFWGFGRFIAFWGVFGFLVFGFLDL